MTGYSHRYTFTITADITKNVKLPVCAHVMGPTFTFNVETIKRLDDIDQKAIGIHLCRFLKDQVNLEFIHTGTLRRKVTI